MKLRTNFKESHFPQIIAQIHFKEFKDSEGNRIIPEMDQNYSGSLWYRKVCPKKVVSHEANRKHIVSISDPQIGL
jgi:hypothetical protein